MFGLDVGLITFNALPKLPAVIQRGASNCPADIAQGHTDERAITNKETTFAAGMIAVLIAAADYKPTGTPSEPQSEDRIVFDDNTGTTITGQVAPPSKDDKCFKRWRGGSVYRVHIKVTKRT